MGFKSWIVRKAAMTKLAFQVKKPTIAVIFGVTCMGAATVVACIETAKKLDGVLDKHNAEMEKIRKAKELEAEGTLEEAKEDKAFIRKATAGTYMRTAGRAIRVYAPSALLMFGGAALIFWGHGVMIKRHALAVASYNTLRARFDEYRARWREKVGEEAERAVFTGEETKLVPSEKDPGAVVEKKVITDNSKNLCQYTFIFDAANAPHKWDRHPGINYNFLVGQQCWANDTLQAKGYLSLNQVLESLGMTQVVDGYFKGWIYDYENPEKTVVDFGLADYAACDPGCHGGGYPDYVLSFNVTDDIHRIYKPYKGVDPMTKRKAKILVKGRRARA